MNRFLLVLAALAMLLAGCNSTTEVTEVSDALRPEVRFYMIADR